MFGDEGDDMTPPPMPMNDMGDMEPPMDSVDEPDMDDDNSPMEDNESDDELMSIFSNLSLEDKAAVKKYAQSLDKGDNVSKDENGEPNGIDDMASMPMESRRSRKSRLSETMDSVTARVDKGSERKDTSLPRQYKGKKGNPFISKF